MSERNLTDQEVEVIAKQISSKVAWRVVWYFLLNSLMPFTVGLMLGSVYGGWKVYGWCMEGIKQAFQEHLK